MIADNIMTEATARIMSGEPSLSVRDFLVAKGVPAFEADARLKDFERGRNGL